MRLGHYGEMNRWFDREPARSDGVEGSGGQVGRPDPARPPGPVHVVYGCSPARRCTARREHSARSRRWRSASRRARPRTRSARPRVPQRSLTGPPWPTASPASALPARPSDDTRASCPPCDSWPPSRARRATAYPSTGTRYITWIQITTLGTLRAKHNKTF